MPLGRQVDHRPGNIALDGDPSAPEFRPMSIMAKRSPISAAAEHLFELSLGLLQLQRPMSYVRTPVATAHNNMVILRLQHAKILSMYGFGNLL